LTPETSLGFECIEFAAWLRARMLELAEAGDEDAAAALELVPELLPWQKWFLIHALELLPGSDVFRFRTVLLLVARQNGKTTLLTYLILWRMFTDGARLTIGTAQSLEKASEAWEAVVTIAQTIPELDDEVAHVKEGKGSQLLQLDSGERYKIASSNRRGGRGSSGDLVFMDELREHQTWQAWSAVSKTQMARERAQLYGVSNAGDAASIVLRHLRKIAHLACGDPDGLNVDAIGQQIIAELDGESAPEGVDDMLDEDSLGIFEWSMKPGADLWDRDGWAQANPSMGYLPAMERAIAAAVRTDPEWEVRTEVFCQWMAGSANGPFPAGSWQQGIDDESKIAKKNPVAVCVDVSWDRSTAWIAFAGFRKDGRPHVELVARRAGTDWVIPWLTSKDRKRRYVGVAWQKNGAPVSSMTEAFEKSSLPVVPWEGQELVRGTGQFFDLVRQVVPDEERVHELQGDEKALEEYLASLVPGVLHRTQEALDAPANTATPKVSGDAWLWDRQKSPVDAAPLVAATGAVWLLLREQVTGSAYDDDEYDELVVV
jgi:hypothetical protein